MLISSKSLLLSFSFYGFFLIYIIPLYSFLFLFFLFYLFLFPAFVLINLYRVCGVNEYFTVLFGDLVASILQEHSLQAMSGMILNN